MLQQHSEDSTQKKKINNAVKIETLNDFVMSIATEPESADRIFFTDWHGACLLEEGKDGWVVVKL